MKEVYEYIQLGIVALFFLLSGTTEYFCFAGLALLILHCIFTQLYLASVESSKPSEKLKIAHYVTIVLVYFCAVGQFGLELFNDL